VAEKASVSGLVLIEVIAILVVFIGGVAYNSLRSRERFRAKRPGDRAVRSGKKVGAKSAVAPCQICLCFVYSLYDLVRFCTKQSQEVIYWHPERRSTDVRPRFNSTFARQ
jgi:hypothetical protein